MNQESQKFNYNQYWIWKFKIFLMQRKKYLSMDKVLIHYEEFDDTTTTDRNSVRHSFNETVYCKK